MPITLDQVKVFPKVLQFWARLNPLSLMQILQVNEIEDPYVDYMAWTPEGVVRGTLRTPFPPNIVHLENMTRLDLSTFPIPPRRGSVWRVLQNDQLIFVSDPDTNDPLKIWVYADWEFNSTGLDEYEDPFYLRLVQDGPISDPTPSTLSDQTAIEQLLNDD